MYLAEHEIEIGGGVVVGWGVGWGWSGGCRGVGELEAQIQC